MANTNRGFNRQKQNRQIKVKEQKKADPLKESAQPENKRSKWSVDNWISFWGLVFNILVAVVTILLFIQTRVSNQIAIRGIENADSANKISKENLELLKKSMQESDSITSLNIGLAKQGVTAQQTSLEQSKSQFILENDAVISAEKMRIVSMQEGYPLTGITHIFVHGKPPVKVIEVKVRMDVFTIVDEKDVDFLIDRITGDGRINQAEITSLRPVQFGVTQDKKNTISDIKDILEKRKSVYIYGQIRYMNTITKKIKAYRFCSVFQDINEQLIRSVYSTTIAE